VPWAGPWNAGGCEAEVLELVLDVLGADEVAAPAIAAPPRASAASTATPASTFLVDRNIGCVLSLIR